MTAPFKKILAPVDLSDKSRGPVEKAAELAKQAHGRVILFHVIEAIDDMPEEEVEEFYQSLEQRAENTLEQWQSELEVRGVPFERVIALGKRGPEVIRFAEENDVDLIVMGSRAVRPDHAGPAFGTISQQVALFARCPVLLLR